MTNVSVLSIFLVLMGCAADFASTTVFDMSYMDELPYFRMAWIIGVLVGGIVSSLLQDFLIKDMFCHFSGALLIFSCIYKLIGDDITAVSICQTLSGIGYGLLFIPSISYAAEISDKEVRGRVISLLSFSFTAGYMLLAICMCFLEVDRENGPRVSYAIIQMTLAIIGSVLCWFNITSPVYLLKKGREPEALVNLKKIRNETFLTPKILMEISDMKDLIRESQEEPFSPFTRDNLKPLVHVAVLQISRAITFSVPMYKSLFFNSMLTIQHVSNYFAVLLLRVVIEALVTYKMDDWGRREMIKGAFIPSSIIYIVYGFLDYYYDKSLSPIPILFVIVPLQVAVGLGISQVATISMVEGFPKRRNSLPLLFALTVEMVVYIVIMCLSLAVDYFYWQSFSNGALLFVFGIYLLKFFPETKRMSLKECHDIYRS